ncbi:hypothetical protein AAEO56_17650 [Flavobacterium sp. DGU11]|uniref:Uncharacterized protein n=1 Tax=Flavobacterium arundinis TaxID=3139143 RepID=A0ABU9I101_9FLAO
MKNAMHAVVFMLIGVNTSSGQVKPSGSSTKVEANKGVRLETKTNVTDKSCFCCGEFYSLPTPLLTGPKEVKCGSGTVFTSPACDGATVIWTVAPAIPGATQTATAFTIPPNAAAGIYTLTRQVSCSRERFVSTQLQFTIVAVANCKPDFLITVTQQPNGLINISTNPLMQAPGQEHWWGIQYNGTYPNCSPQAPIPFSSFTPTGVWGGYISSAGNLTTYMGSPIWIVNGYGISYSGTPNNSCIKVTHYVKCCGQLMRQTAYFSIGTSNLRIKKSDKPVELKTEIIMTESEVMN